MWLSVAFSLSLDAYKINSFEWNIIYREMSSNGNTYERKMSYVKSVYAHKSRRWLELKLNDNDNEKVDGKQQWPVWLNALTRLLVQSRASGSTRQPKVREYMQAMFCKHKPAINRWFIQLKKSIGKTHTHTFIIM